MNYTARHTNSNYSTSTIVPFKTISGEISHRTVLPIQPSRAPLATFDEYGDIPVSDIQQSSSSSHMCTYNGQQDIVHEYCCCLCSWERYRKDFCRFLIQFLFSQLGLIILVFIYIMMGGLLFYTIESKYELRKNEQIKIKHLHHIHNIRHIVTEEFNWMLNASFELRYALWRGMLSRLDAYDDTLWHVKVQSERFDRLIDNELAHMQADEEKLADKQDAPSDASYNQKWTFSTAMLYSATLITTVGFGNIAPKSMSGKLITCLYAMIGIPIMIVYLTNTKNEAVQHNVPIIVAFGVLVLYIVAGGILFSYWEGWSYVDGAYFSFITFTTIGLGDLVPGKGTLTENKNGKSILCALYLLFGLAFTAMCFKLMQEDLFAFKQWIFTRLGFDNYYSQSIHYERSHRIHTRANNT
ncbi:unnamed protein product [Adineta steineri]|uniref:Potassium channel domain-containing protein n=1 Tax=Adineta steineri TaxID=433720 RepID=A0A814E9T3_9BILA|nr:unnamed protein product [Adineta steineri]CAF3570777.1 unnamed protein product [Adineta steineri]CAF3739459.1 unnamed protein product [Adineta steineri]